METGAHRRSTDADSSREIALGRQSIARLQTPALNQSPHESDDLLAAAFCAPARRDRHDLPPV